VASSDTRSVIEEYFAALAGRDWPRLYDLLAEDVEWRMPRSIPDNLHAGREKVGSELSRDVVKRFFAKGSYRMTTGGVIVDGDVAVVRQHVDALTKDGRPYDMDYCFIYTVRDRRITLIEEFLDTRLAADLLDLGRP
jgi:ketosteroid isomerase-like protein